MLYGICGPSRSGKTTLAKKLAEDLGCEFYATSTTEVAKKFGFDPCAPMTLKDRVALQVHLLENHLRTIKDLPRPCITDRTPLDMLAYLTCEFSMNSDLLVDPDSMAAANTLVQQCMEATVLNYDMVYYLSPLDTYAIDPTKSQPTDNPVYHKHYGLVLQGALYELQDRLDFVVIENGDLDFRSDYVHTSIVERMDYIDQMRHTAPFH